MINIHVLHTIYYLLLTVQVRGAIITVIESINTFLTTPHHKNKLLMGVKQMVTPVTL